MTLSVSRPATRPGKPLLLIAAIVAAGFIGLSIHVFALLIGIDYPAGRMPGWATWLNVSASIAATIVFLKLAAERLERLSFTTRLLVVFLLVAALKETLRRLIMNGVATSAYAFAFISATKFVVTALILALISVVVAPRIRTIWSLGIAALVLGAVYKGLEFAASAVLDPMIAQFAHLDHPPVYFFPYPLSFQIPAYLTFWSRRSPPR